MAKELDPEVEAATATEEVVETPQAEEAVAESKTPNRDAWMAGIRAKNPDLAEDDEEGLYGAAMKGYDAEHEYAKQQREDTGRLAEIMESNPALAAVFAEIYERGKDGNPEMALRNLDPDLKSYINGDMSDEEYETGKANKANAKAEADKAEADKQAKMDAQEKVFQKVCEDRGLDYDETMQKLGELLLRPMSEYGLGEKEVTALINMLNYDEDVQAAEVRGRNAQIEAKKRKMERQSDGLPNGASAAALAPEKETALQRIASRRAAVKNL